MPLTHEPLAHLSKDGARPHLLTDHLGAVGALAAEFASAFDAAEWARLAGRWHDLGKYSPDFQVRIREENGFEAHLEGVTIGVRDHSTAGAIHAFERFDQVNRRGHGLPIAFAIAGHHAGLADVADLRCRLREKRERLEAALAGGAPQAILEPSAPLPPLPPFGGGGSPERQRDLELWIRLLFSALCDGDYRASAALVAFGARSEDKVALEQLKAGGSFPSTDVALVRYWKDLPKAIKKYASQLAARGFCKEEQARLHERMAAFERLLKERGDGKSARKRQGKERDGVFAELRWMTQYFRRVGRAALRTSPERVAFDRVSEPPRRGKKPAPVTGAGAVATGPVEQAAPAAVKGALERAVQN